MEMVDISGKEETLREAEAFGEVILSGEVMRAIKDGRVPKGDVMEAARLAGIMGAKKTSELIPLCHPIPIDHISVDLEPGGNSIKIRVKVKVKGKTGAEMEAMVGVAITALTIYDMIKGLDMGARIERIRLGRKRGGKSGEVVL